MTPADLTAKAQRAAEWFKSVHGEVVKKCDDGFWAVGYTPFCTLWSDSGLCSFAEDHGWQDDHASEPQELVKPCADEHEALDCCARGMAQTMDEVDPDPVQIEEGSRYGKSHIEAKEESRPGNSPNGADGVEWETETIDSTMVGKLMVVARTAKEGGGWDWSVWDNEDWDSKAEAEGTAPTREEARAAAVEAARALGK